MNIRQTLILFIGLLLFAVPSEAQQRGKATYYSRRATGMRTSDGSRHHADSMICAHRKYPFGTKLKVTNPANGKVVVVKVTDRGPFAKGRIIDLSYGAAQKLGILSQGVAMVIVEPYVEPNTIPYRVEEKVDLPEMDYEVTQPDGKMFGKEAGETEKKTHNDTKTAAKTTKSNK